MLPDYTMSPAAEKITIRWLIDHVPIKFWIGSSAIAVGLFGAGITFSKYDFINHWFNDLVFDKSDVTIEKYKEKNEKLEKENKIISQGNKNNINELSKLKKELNISQERNNKLNQNYSSLLLVNNKSTVESDLKSENEENKNIKIELISKLKKSEELINSLNHEISTLKTKIDEKRENTKLVRSESITNSSVIHADEKDIIARYKAALKIPGYTTQTKILNELAIQAADYKYFKTAFKIALNISGFTTQSSTLSYVALKTAESGDIEYAIEIAEEISGSTTKSETLAKIAQM